MKSLILILLLAAHASAGLLQKNSLDSQSGDSDADSENFEQHITDVSEFEASNEEDQDTGLIHWYGGSKIAFSTYLSKSYEQIGRKQHVKFDKVLLNDGNGYDVQTGVFRAPVCGVYMFTYVIAQRHHREIAVTLMYDGNVVNSAIAEGVSEKHDTQGTNTAIIHVTKGKAVWVEAANNGHLEGNYNHRRYTTFSGFLLYARR